MSISFSRNTVWSALWTRQDWRHEPYPAGKQAPVKIEQPPARLDRHVVAWKLADCPWAMATGGRKW